MSIPRRTVLGFLAAAPLAQMVPSQQVAQSARVAPQRRRVVPLDFIQRYKLTPSQNPYGPYLLGQDGMPYDFDDIMWAVFEMTRDHWQIPRK